MNEPTLLLSFADAAELLSVSRALLYQMHGDARFGPQVRKLGRRSLIVRAELERWVQSGLPPRSQWLKMGTTT
jgi:predicted DNA-binding transcriptional regulator AlpA